MAQQHNIHRANQKFDLLKEMLSIKQILMKQELEKSKRKKSETFERQFWGEKHTKPSKTINQTTTNHIYTHTHAKIQPTNRKHAKPPTQQAIGY